MEKRKLSDAELMGALQIDANTLEKFKRVSARASNHPALITDPRIVCGDKRLVNYRARNTV